MSLRTVARDDFTNARRSYAVLGVVGVFTALVALIVGMDSGHHPDFYRALLDVSFFLFLVFPIIVAPLAYLAIAGDRDGGAIKYVMGLPNTRAEYVFGKLVSRLGVALAAVLVGMLVALAIGFASYTNAPALDRFAKFTGLMLLFAFSFIGIYVGISAVTASRSRAMLGVFGAYFFLVPFWFGFLPVVGLPALVNTAADLLGVNVSSDTQSFIRSLSPATAYLFSTKIVYQGVHDTYPMIAQNFEGAYTSDELQAQFWFNALVMFVWGAGSMLVGYLSFRRSELG
ncbi:ABC transporter permease subunit [Halobacterium yunchengense]|uniref:ABC transporter permease subunit n=1 Tax=Halobacterium yunchengense TaxID=3108497 RepID=UPI00300A62CF